MGSCCSRFAVPVLLAGMLVLGGCHKAAETAVEDPAEEQKPVDIAAQAGVPTPNDPAAAWQGVADGMAQGNADLAEALPDEYRADLDRLLKERLEPIAPEVRRETSEAIAELAQTLAQKEAFVLGSERFNFGGPAAPLVRNQFAPLCRVVATVARWPGWADADAPSSTAVIAEVARAFKAEPALVDRLRSVRFENADVQPHQSLGQIVVRTPSSKEARTIAVARVGDRWLPQALVNHWSQLLGAARKDELGADAAQREVRVRELSSRLREISATLKAVETQEEFEALVERASTLLMASAAEANSAPRRVESDEFVTVLVRGTLTNEQKDQLVWQLVSLSDEPASALADALEQADGDAFVIQVGPVRDVSDFATRLKGLAVDETDPSAKKITARVAAP